jgi:DNA-binding GntR family transcriptional regulator
MAEPASLNVTVAPLLRDTMQEQIYRQVCELILDGGIAPGQHVTVQSLARAFGVSAMPVREALKRLTAANALTTVSGRSVGVPHLSRPRLTDLRDVRLQVEGTAVEWAAKRVENADLPDIQAQLSRMDHAVGSGDVKEYLRANHSFHFAIYRNARSPILLGIIETLWLEISPYFNLLHASGNFQSSNLRHREVFEAVRQRDGTSASKAIRADIMEACSALLDELV